MPGLRENWEDCNHGPPGFLAMRSSESEALFKLEWEKRSANAQTARDTCLKGCGLMPLGDRYLSEDNYVIGPVLTGQPFPDGWERSELTQLCSHLVWECCLQKGPSGFVQQVVRCRECHAPRCGSSKELNPCMLVRHHTLDHFLLNGRTRPLG